MPPFIIPFFIVHEGCPHRCVFCDQEKITGKSDSQPVSANQISTEIAEVLARPRRFPDREVQVAFYGGSFTSLPEDRQTALLDAVHPFLRQGRVHSIRVSTRPDGIGPKTAGFLADKGVRLVEIGVQSMDSHVLRESGRGYEPDTVQQAFAYLQRGGLSVGGQLMIGLPGETTAGVVAGSYRLAELRPACVRLYPTLVMRGSVLAARYASGHYRALGLHRAIALTARLKNIFSEHNIPVIRMGLQASGSLEENILAGPYHPAFGEMVLGRIFFTRIRKLLHNRQKDAAHRLVLAATDESLFRGKGNCSRQRLQQLGLLDRVEVVFDQEQPRHSVRLHRS